MESHSRQFLIFLERLPMWINNGPIDMNGNAIDYDDTIIYKNNKYDILRMITWKDDEGPHWKLHVKCLKKFSHGKYMQNDVIDVYPDMVEVDKNEYSKSIL